MQIFPENTQKLNIALLMTLEFDPIFISEEFNQTYM